MFLNNKYKKISLIAAYTILIILTIIFFLKFEMNEYFIPLRNILIGAVLIGPVLFLGLGILTIKYSMWLYSKSANEIGINITKIILPVTIIIFLGMAIYNSLSGNAHFITSAFVLAYLIPLYGVFYDDALGMI